MITKGSEMGPFFFAKNAPYTPKGMYGARFAIEFDFL